MSEKSNVPSSLKGLPLQPLHLSSFIIRETIEDIGHSLMFFGGCALVATAVYVPIHVFSVVAPDLFMSIQF